ncbi:MAG TPA: hypothetical protein VD811_05115 [Desulfuromonadales bacterium]|nr:hypothetical protein [Desulfuromonadales bacterium]
MIRKFLEKSRCLIAIALVNASSDWFVGLLEKSESGAGGTDD